MVSENDQSLEINIDNMYQKFIVEVDKIRSVDEQDLKESRCHAFYRLIGLPISDGNDLYCPGFDKPNNTNSSVQERKKNIAKNIDFKLNMLMNDREYQSRSYLSTFSLKNVNSSALVMSSVDIRPFSASFKNEDFFDYNADNQSYIISLVNSLNKIVIDSSGNKSNISSTRYHFLKPLMVNPDIDNNIKPFRNRIAVPFLKNKIDLKINNNEYLKRPYIEKVARDRFGPPNTNIGSNTQSIINNIKNDPLLNSTNLVKSITADNYWTSVDAQIANYLLMIKSMIQKLNEAVKEVDFTLVKSVETKESAKFNWIPVPNNFGPEISCQTQSIYNQFNNPNNTNKDKDIIKTIYNVELNKQNNKITQDTVVDLGNFAFDNIEPTPDKNSSNAVIDNNEKQLKQQLDEREGVCNSANSAMRVIEIIMGEFSGLGLCDIFAICLALWTIDEETLFNLFDDVTKERMAQIPELKLPSNGTASIDVYLNKYEQKVKEILDLMQKMYNDVRTISSSNKPPQ